jgi:PEGA domain
MIGIGIGPDGKPILKHPTPLAVPPLAANPPAPAPTPAASPAAPTPAPANLAAAPQNLGTAATMIMTPAGAVAPAATPPRVETRAPRAAETLPANPLSEFDADEVNSFIECTLIEAEDAPGAHLPDGPTTADAPLAAAAAAVRRTTAYVRAQQLAAKLPPGVQSKLLRFGPYLAVGIVCLLVGRFLMRPAQPRAVAVQSTAAPPSPSPSPSSAPTPPVAQIIPPETAEKKVAAAEKKLVALEKKAAPEETKARPAETLAEKPATEERPAPPSERSEPPAARPVVAAGTPGVCTARVVTEPKDAKVIWGNKEIGRSPIDGARVACGAVKVTIERERWQPVSVDVDMQAGDAAVVRQRLHRPRGALIVSSSPPGAQISVNHVFVGSAPTRVDASRYEKVAIKAALKGYQTWNKNVYLKEAETKIDVQLASKK